MNNSGTISNYVRSTLVGGGRGGKRKKQSTISQNSKESKFLNRKFS